MSVHDWDQWREDNPEWERDWSDPSTFPNFGEVGEVYDKLMKSHPGWNDVLHKASKAPGSSKTTLILNASKKKKESRPIWNEQ
jgi:hypothetical protein